MINPQTRTFWRLMERARAGYLPGMMQPHIKFFGIMSLTYLMLGIVWAALYAQHWKEVVGLQHFITGVVALGMMEMSTWYRPLTFCPSCLFE